MAWDQTEAPKVKNFVGDGTSEAKQDQSSEQELGDGGGEMFSIYILLCEAFQTNLHNMQITKDVWRLLAI